MLPRRAQTFHTAAESLKDQNFFVHPVLSPYSSKTHFVPSLANAVLATALFRCWHIILFFSGWAACVTLITRYVHDVSFQSTLLNVFGTVLGFVISYRTSSSFERYNEGRRLWSSIIYATRCFARAVWFHVPDFPGLEADKAEAETRSRVLIEKKTVINLLQAFSVAVKHYLRGEDGIYFVDLYPLVKFLPSYALPPSIPSPLPSPLQGYDSLSPDEKGQGSQHPFALPGQPVQPVLSASTSAPHLPSTTGPPLRKVRTQTSARSYAGQPHLTIPGPPMPQLAERPTSPLTRMKENLSPILPIHSSSGNGTRPRGISLGPGEDPPLAPSQNPPKYHLFDVFPFSLFVKFLTKRGKDVKGKRAARIRARLAAGSSHNIPLEISFYLTSYVSALQQRKCIDVATTNLLLNSLNMLVDSLTGLERILTTPIPFSYNVHLWSVTVIYIMTLPFQLYKTMGWLTIPGTAIASFFFFGFISLGAEIENPFGYDKNDLNLDHFTNTLIAAELAAITSVPAPNVSTWAFVPENDQLFAPLVRGHGAPKSGPAFDRVAPEEWVRRGENRMREMLLGP
ncbi:UPF0187-domain-containing protein [Auricularia subglabra TFB-10046 SS5]|nr:UPF0187-domain-containing protein [Auricularia subglabra TFB-10046 SS5]